MIETASFRETFASITQSTRGLKPKEHNQRQTAVTVPEPTRHVMLQPVRENPSIVFKHSKCKNDFFPQVLCVFVVEHFLASHYYLSCQNEFRDTSSDSPVSNRTTESRLMNRFCDTETLHLVASNLTKEVNICIIEGGGHFQRLI
jgi:hypothetical protein